VSWWDREQEQYQDEGWVGERWGSAGSGLLFTTGSRVLLLLRSPYVADPGCWGIPGGAIPVSKGDGRRLDAFASAVKEAEEELGVEPLPPYRVAGSVVYRDGGFVYTTFVLAVEDAVMDSMEPVLNWESDDWRWFTERELRSVRVHPGVEHVLREARRMVFRT